MRPRRLSEVVELMLPGPVRLVGDPEVVVGPDVVTDNRAATPGAVFVAIPGARVDGHDFATAAATAGAAVILGTRETKAPVPHLVCDESVAGLSRLARGLVEEARQRGMRSIGITGSSGKTSTKDLLAQILEPAGATVSPRGSQNNEIGVPLTACRIADDTAFLVSEMGARGLGHISHLLSLVGVDVGVVLNVGSAHVGEFGDIEHTALAKSEMVSGLDEGDWAVLNADDPRVAAMATATRAKIAWFGEGELPTGDLQVRALDVRGDELSRPGFTLEVRRGGDRGTAAVQLGVVGRHQTSNALAAAAAALAVGLDVDEVAAGLSAATQRSAWRMELHRRADGVLIVNDAYNANPDSMAAALRTTAELAEKQRREHPGARAIAVLGDMLELGDAAEELHRLVGKLAADLGFAEVVAVGGFATAVAEAAGADGVAAQVLGRDQVAAALRPEPGDVVLIKGSRGVGLEAVAAALLEGDRK